MRLKGLNQAHAGCRLAWPGFLRSLSCGYVSVSVCVCVHPRGYEQLVARFGLNMIGLIIPVASQLGFMNCAVDIIHECDPSDKMLPQLQTKKTKVRLF